MGNEVLVAAPDDIADWNSLQSYLGKRGYDVWRAFTPGEAFRIARTQPIKAVLSDYGLPGCSGLVFLRKVKAIAPNVELIFLSRSPTLSKAIKAMKDGAYDFYEFPVNRRLLLAVLEKAFEKEALTVEKVNLERRVKEKYGFENIIGRSKAMLSLLEKVGSIASKNVTVLLTGETGTGKELIANAIHCQSPRGSQPFIRAGSL